MKPTQSRGKLTRQLRGFDKRRKRGFMEKKQQGEGVKTRQEVSQRRGVGGWNGKGKKKKVCHTYRCKSPPEAGRGGETRHTYCREGE